MRKKLHHIYDIHLDMGCASTPEIERLLPAIPALANPTVQARIMQRLPAPDFLGLDLSENEAIDLLKVLIAAGAAGVRLSSAYRQPRITREQATAIAEEAIATEKKTLESDRIFAPLRLLSVREVCWSFEAFSKQGSLFAYVDKVDGHLWSQQNLEHLYDETHMIQLELLREKAQVAQLPITRWTELFKTYDLFLRRGSQTLPNLDDLAGKIPSLRDPILLKRIVQHPSGPGFLGLDLPYDVALSLQQCLKTTGAEGFRLPAAYRSPRLTIEQAQAIAQADIDEQKQKYDPNEILLPIEFLGEREVCWEFRGTTARLDGEGQEGYGLYAQVDKVDGHIWTSDEMTLFHQENGYF